MAATDVAPVMAAAAVAPEVQFICVRKGSKLRVRVTSPGYNPNANCQFPRDLRAENRSFTAPASAVTFARGPRGAVFYRVKVAAITLVVVPEDERQAQVRRVFGDDDDDPDCCVCMDVRREQVFVPCGHFCCCAGCAAVLRECPICRAAVTDRVNRDEIREEDDA